MDRRELLGALSLGTAGLLAGRSARADDDDDEKRGHHHPHHKVKEDCMEACEDCAEACGTTFHHCFQLVEEGKKDHARAARLALDCAAFCGLSLNLILRDSELMAHACDACADACEQCGSECAKFDSEVMRECARECKSCEDACRSMVRAMRGGDEPASR